MKKKMLALVLSVGMVLSLAACGEKKPDPTPTAAPSAAGEPSASGETAKDFGGAELVVATWGWAEAGLKTLAADFEKTYN